MADVVLSLDSGAAGTEFLTVEAMRNQGCEVDCVWADSLPRKIAHGNLHYLLELPAAYRAVMLERMRQKDYDVIHVNQPHGYLAAQAIATGPAHAVFIHRSHGIELRGERELARWRRACGPPERRSSGKAWARLWMARLLSRHGRAIAKYADGHIVSASDCARFMLAELGVPEDRVAVIPQAAPPAYVEQSALAMTPARAKRMLYVGQYTSAKAPSILAAAIERIMQSSDEPTLTWVTPKASHATVCTLLSERARPRVTLRDWMPQDELMSLYDSHGIFLFPSLFEGFGKVFIEAMARGLCVVAADNSGAKDVIRDGEDGRLVPTGDARALADACLELIRSQADAKVLGERAAVRARQYTWDRVGRETIAFYRNCIAQKRRQPLLQN